MGGASLADAMAQRLRSTRGMRQFLESVRGLEPLTTALPSLLCRHVAAIARHASDHRKHSFSVAISWRFSHCLPFKSVSKRSVPCCPRRVAWMIRSGGCRRLGRHLFGRNRQSLCRRSLRRVPDIYHRAQPRAPATAITTPPRSGVATTVGVTECSRARIIPTSACRVTLAALRSTMYT